MPQHPVIRSLAGLAVAAFAAFAMVTTGCSVTSQAAQQTRLGIVVGSHANMPTITPESWAQALDPYLVEGVHAAVVTDEGAPRLLGTGSLSDLSSNRDTYREQVDAFRSGLLGVVATAKASSPESDPLMALGEVSRALRGTAGSCTVVIGASLLQTSGVLPFQRGGGLLRSEPADVVESLAPDQLPDLTGCAVVVLGAGLTQAPQAPLDEASQQRLEAIFVAVLKASHASSITFAPRPVSTPSAIDLPPVTPVPVPTAEVAKPTNCAVELAGAVLTFQPDTAEFVSPSQAETVVARIAEQLSGCAGTLNVVGTTSSAGTEEGRQRLSAARATAVRDLLAQVLRVAPETIPALGLGYDTAVGNCVVDRVDGLLDPVLAAQNRKVTISVAPTR